MTEFDFRDDADSLFNSQYMRWFDLEGSDLLVEIVKVERNVPLVLPGGVESKKPVLHWKKVQGKSGVCKPLVLNVTNKQQLVELLGRSVSGWVGKQVVLYQSTAKLRGKDVPAIRIRKVKR